MEALQLLQLIFKTYGWPGLFFCTLGFYVWQNRKKLLRNSERVQAERKNCSCCEELRLKLGKLAFEIEYSKSAQNQTNESLRQDIKEFKGDLSQLRDKIDELKTLIIQRGVN
jgi:hypothetical protein